jgi:hypothetical protein
MTTPSGEPLDALAAVARAVRPRFSDVMPQCRLSPDPPRGTRPPFPLAIPPLGVLLAQDESEDEIPADHCAGRRLADWFRQQDHACVESS